MISGGLGDLLNQLQQKGHGDTANSWVSNGPDKAISPGDLASALGADQIDSLSSQSGLSRDELLQASSQYLPDAVNHLTPDGRLPDENEVSRPDLTFAAVAALTPRYHFCCGIGKGRQPWAALLGIIAVRCRHHRAPAFAGTEQSERIIPTTVLGIIGEFLATFIGQAIGHYGPDQCAGFITATIGALIVLFIRNRLVAAGVIFGYEQINDDDEKVLLGFKITYCSKGSTRWIW